jgi:flagellar hook-associated protein 3 FlgL
MRISTAFRYEESYQSIQTAQQQEYQYQQELSTGKRILEPSDDPFGTYQSLSMTDVQNTLNQYNSNLTYANSVLTASSNSLTNINNIANQAYQLAVQGANSSVDQTALSGMATQVATLQQQLVSAANSQGVNGEYIFGGQKTNAPPYAVSGNSLVYSGDNGNLNVEVGPSQTMAVNTQASSTFTTLYNQLEQLKDDLNSGNVGSLSNVDISALQSSQSALSLAQGVVGGNLQEAGKLSNANTLRITDLTSQISNITDANVAQVATQYQAASNAYQAAIEVAAQLSTMSLASYIQPAAA